MTIRILYLTAAEPADRSYGGALRSQHVREALQGCAAVDTVVIQSAHRTLIDEGWGHNRTKRALYGPGRGAYGAWRERWRVRCVVARALRDDGYDFVVARCIGLAAFVPIHRWSSLVLDADDLRKSGPMVGGQRLKRTMRNAAARLATLLPKHVWYVSSGDAALGLRRLHSSLLPNVTALPDPGRPRAEALPHRLLFVGYLRYGPNQEGLRWFVERVLPRLRERFPTVELHAIGRLPDLALDLTTRDGLVLRGFVDDLASEYDRAACVIAPVFSGAGTQIKVIDALAHGRPLVTSRFSHAGFAHDLSPGRDLCVADGDVAWYEQCVWVLAHPELAARMARSGEAVVRERYGTDRLREGVAEVIRPA